MAQADGLSDAGAGNFIFSPFLLPSLLVPSLYLVNLPILCTSLHCSTPHCTTHFALHSFGIDYTQQLQQQLSCRSIIHRVRLFLRDLLLLTFHVSATTLR